MSWSLNLSNGDLTLNGFQYGTVTGEQKLAQDLRAYILEKMGTDDMHPEYGSLIDGGIRKGRFVRGVIGSPNAEWARLQVESEIRRIFDRYQARQLSRAKDDKMTYGRITLNRGEVAIAISKIDIQAVEDSLQVNVTIETARDTSLTIDMALEHAAPLR